MLEVKKGLRGKSLRALNDTLAPDARRVLHRIAVRIAAGQTKHGQLNIKRDTRNWSRETREEMDDVIVYRIIAEIACERVALAEAYDRVLQRCNELLAENRKLNRQLKRRARR